MNRKRKPNRTVALLTPIAAAGAGLASAWLAKRLGVKVDEDTLQQVFIAGALVVVAPALQWLNGWQKYEARQAELERDLELQNAAVPVGGENPWALGDAEELEEDVADELEELDELDELEELSELDEEDVDEDGIEDDEPTAVGG
jgi:hypothetical protein